MSTVARAMRYARTVSHLRPVQVWGRLWRELHNPRLDLAPAPPRRGREARVPFAERAPTFLDEHTVRLLNVERSVRTAADWDDPEVPLLWRYHLHYFEDLAAPRSDQHRAVQRAWIERWIRDNPPGRGSGWEPYPTSRRVCFWIRAALGGLELSPEALDSLAIQVRWVRANLEHHLLGNHLLANAKALVLGGLFFCGPEADGWLKRGCELVARELREQVLADGGHFERSPMYHALVLEDLLDLIAAQRALDFEAIADEARAWRRTAASMLRWLSVMTHPDGRIALFNDAAFGIAPEPHELTRVARALRVDVPAPPRDGVVVLPESGYVRLERGGATCLLDVGEIGPSYLPGHAHADTLSFELSLGGERAVVDTGASLYEVGDERDRQRGTAAHNTVCVDGADSSEVWASFRVARRAHPRALSIDEGPDGLVVRCEHDGYLRLSGRVVHRRTWTLDDRALLVEDALEGSWTSAVSRLHLAPDAPALDLSSTGGVLRDRAGTWHPEFGRSVPIRVAENHIERPESSIALRW